MDETVTGQTPEELAAARLPAPLPPSEKEALEGKIIELKEQLAAALTEISELKKPRPTPKKKSFHERFSPL